MFEPITINVICPQCKLTWMCCPAPNRNYICYQCGFILDEEHAKKAAWQSGSIYYGE